MLINAVLELDKEKLLSTYEDKEDISLEDLFLTEMGWVADSGIRVNSIESFPKSVEEDVAKKTSDKPEKWECAFLEWSGSQRHPVAKREVATGIIKGSFFYLDDGRKKRIEGKGFEKIRQISSIQSKEKSLADMQDCPLGGDIENDCVGCAYSIDYHFLEGECICREDN